MITQQRTTGNILQARRVIDVRKKIDVLEPDSAPLLQLTRKMEKKVAINPKFSWLEEESLVKSDQINNGAGYTSGATSIVVDNGSRFRAGDVVKHLTSGEQMLVTAVSTNTLTVTRGWGVTAAAAFTDNDYVLIVGNANKEHATKRAQKIGDQVERVNYTQIFRTPFGISRTAMNSEMNGGNDKKQIRMMQLIEHDKEIERGFWFGEPKEDTSTDPIRATGGADYWIATNAQNMGLTMTELEFGTFLRTGFRYGGKTKYLFTAPIGVQAIEYWAKQKLQILPKEKTYGLSIAQYLSPFGVVNIVLSNLFAETTLFGGYMYLIDIEGLEYRYLENSDTKLKTNIQDPSADGEEDEFLTEAGLGFNNEKKSAVAYNITDFS